MPYNSTIRQGHCNFTSATIVDRARNLRMKASKTKGGYHMDTNFLDIIDMRELGKELQQARFKRGLTQEEAAKFIDVARTTITAIEKGERRIKAEELIKLAYAYGREAG